MRLSPAAVAPRARPALWGFAVCTLAMSWAGCNCPPKIDSINQCDGVVGVQEDRLGACTDNSECGDHYSCVQNKDKNIRCCVFAPRQCLTEADCCPGQTCPASRKQCVDSIRECATDADCGDTGDLTCQDWVDRGTTTKRCRFTACSGANKECPDGKSCFQGECMSQLPCDGACEPGKACVPTINRCQDYQNPTGRPEAACPMSCNQGFIASFIDNRNLWDTCAFADVKCVCAELPGLRSEDMGRHSAIALEPGKGTWVSTYDGQYGDLAVYHFDLNGQRLSLEYIDGVPQGTAKYGPSGARGGITEPGDDVGRYTDIAVGNNGIVYVSYYDVTNGNLRFAMRTPDGTWSKMRVDGETANLGLFTSVAVDQDGIPGISYFQRGADSAFNPAECPGTPPVGAKQFISALKFAKATTATPGPGDWSIKTLACAARAAPACNGCGAGSVCADPDTGPACYAPSSSCVLADGGGTCDTATEVCVVVSGAPRCAKKYNPSTLDDLPQGIGLFSSLAFNGKEAHIAFMRRQSTGLTTPADGDLMGVTVSGAGTAGALVLLDASGDTGYFPDVKVDPGTKKLAVAYHDATSKALKFYFANAFQTGVVTEVIDRGTGAAGSGEANWVGTDSALVFGNGGLWAVYQDATKGDLKLAKRSSSWQVQPSIATEGAVGFFADAVYNDGKLICSHARIHTKLIAATPHVDNSLLVEQVAAP